MATTRKRRRQRASGSGSCLKRYLAAGRAGGLDGLDAGFQAAADLCQNLKQGRASCLKAVKQGRKAARELRESLEP